MNEKTIKTLEFDKIIKKLVNLTSSSLGKDLAKDLVPECNFKRVKEFLKETSDGVNCIISKGSPPLGGIYDIKDSIKRAEIGSVLNPGELLKISGVLRAVRNMKNYASNDRIEVEEDNVVNELIGLLEKNRPLEDRINKSIISEEEVADTASGILNSIRRQIRNSQESIKNKLNEIIRSSKHQKYMQESIVTMRGDRYVVPVKQEYRSEIPGLIHDSSASGATIFIEPMAVVEANNNIRELKIKERAEIEKILREITEEVGQMEAGLKSNVSLLAKLDFIFAKAKLSFEYKCICPKINDEHKIVIKKGRHPLLDVETVVPIDFWIGEDFDTLVVTGPNTGGKTVTLKTVGLFTLMMQAGLHVPANDGTSLSVFNKVYADVGDEQSIEQSLSTFSSHMKNIVDILDSIDDNSLVLFDELGAGTDPTEGAALAMSILENTRKRGCITVATTHYSQLKVYALTTNNVENACCEFNVETLQPTYRLLIGVPGKSNAFAISKRLGLKEKIIERAREFLTIEDIKFEDMLQSIEKNLSKTEDEKLVAEKYRLEAEDLKREIKERKEKLEKNRERLIREAREESRKILLDAKREAEEIVLEMKRLEKESQIDLRQKKAEEMRLRLKNKIDNIEGKLSTELIKKNKSSKPPKNLKPGDTVLIVNLNQKATVVEPPDKDGEVLVQAGIMKVNVHISSLKQIDEQKKHIEKSGIGRIGASKAKSISTEIDLRGCNLVEALDMVDKYLDDAIIAGLTEVSIIHGKGTGVLRGGIQQHLKSNPYIKSFRLGRYGEGESGVTIVELGNK